MILLECSTFLERERNNNPLSIRLKISTEFERRKLHRTVTRNFNLSELPNILAGKMSHNLKKITQSKVRHRKLLQSLLVFSNLILRILLYILPVCQFIAGLCLGTYPETLIK